MNRLSLPQPGLVYGLYPENHHDKDFFDTAFNTVRDKLKPRATLPVRFTRFAQAVIDRSDKLVDCSEEEFAAAIHSCGALLKQHRFTDEGLLDAMALTRETIRRHLGVKTYPTQVIAARIMLDKSLAEMQTGEGKTYAIAMAALTSGLAEIPTHVITANDYLVTRDANQLRAIAERLNLTVGAVVAGMTPEQRAEQYASDITYCTARELAFDYLKDKAAGEVPRSDLHRRVQQLDPDYQQTPLLRGLCLAIVDEADSIFLDESYTPLILSKDGKNTVEAETYHEAYEISALLQKKRDFEFHPHTHKGRLTAHGRTQLNKHCEPLSGLWRNPHFREEVVVQALLARHTYRRDRDYLVKDGEVHIIDSVTGRIAEGRKWSRGLHSLIEIKEDCANTGQRHTLAQITYQRFFPRYLHICGASATLNDSRREILNVYALQVYSIPLHQQSLRTNKGTRVFLNREDKWRATVAATKRLQDSGRPVLVGTDSVGDSEILSQWFDRNNVPHRVLNARKDGEEAAIIANAGVAGRVTIATNMAGRGTDIKLSASARSSGGLHVICCQHNASKRIDRQLHGRCARQGDPGSFETILSIEDPVIQSLLPDGIRRWLRGFFDKQKALPSVLGLLIADIAQRIEERRFRQLRRQLRKQDVQLKKALGVSGPRE